MSMAGAAGDGLLRGVFDGCISGGDFTVQRRPYHKNCKCALHKSRGRCNHSPRNGTVSYPIRRSWSEGSLALMTNPPPTTTGAASPGAANSPNFAANSPNFAAAPMPGQISRTQTQLVLFKEEDEEGEDVSVFCKI